MPFFTATSDVATILMAGGLGVAERLLGMGWDSARVFAELVKKFTPLGGQPYAQQVYSAIINRAEAALISGRLLNRKRNNVPLNFDQHTGMPGLSNEYQYSVVIGFRDVGGNREFTRVFRLGADAPLGRFDVLALAQQQALAFMGNVPDYSPYANAAEIELTGAMRITDALVRI